MPKTRKVETSLEFAFFQYLWEFYRDNRGIVRNHYKELSRRYLDFNNPERNPTAFLRTPQFEALEIYVFLKEFLDNEKVEQIFEGWHNRKGRFLGRKEGGYVGDRSQGTIFEAVTEDQYRAVFQRMKQCSRKYPNYIFALTMGTGKTILMGTCIFYEFILANKFPKDARFCHNALVFAPDTTVLRSLREIESFDLAKVVPPEYVGFLVTQLRFHYLEEAGTSLDTLDKSRFNIIVSNTQKIILKRKHKEESAALLLFAAGKPTFAAGSVYDAASDLYSFDQPEDEGELTTNQRFEKLCRLEQLGIYVDEAHHAFGKKLAKDMGVGTSEDDTSLRTTIDMLAGSLEKAKTHVVACYNYTGTPYVGQEVLPEVVYAYGLREAIERGYLKKVMLHGYTTTKSKEFVDVAIDDFMAKTKDLAPEGLTPKLAFFAATIDELTKELRPAVEKALEKRGIPTSRILVNVGDDKLTTNDDIREFNRLDTMGSDKQFILLVNKGREGWNCRSLFGVALFREPKSKIFVLQASMRCLRSIGEAQHTAQVYLTEANRQILDDELLKNFHLSAEELQNLGNDKEIVQVRVTQPPVKIKLVRVRKTFEMTEKKPVPGTVLGLKIDDATAWEEQTRAYRLIHTTREGLGGQERAAKETKEDMTVVREKVQFSEMTLVAEIARYLNRSPIEIEELLVATHEGLELTLKAVNEFNEILYDVVIPNLFGCLFDLKSHDETEEHEVELVKAAPAERGYYELSAAKDKIVRMGDLLDEERTKSFHLDTYCFDSMPELALFWDLVKEKRIQKIYFTGMLTHGQSEFFVQYIDPDTHTVRSYYPDFLFQRDTGGYVILEVKGDNKIEDRVVQAKKTFASQVAVASGMEYRIIKGSDAISHQFGGVFEELSN